MRNAREFPARRRMTQVEDATRGVLHFQVTNAIREGQGPCLSGMERPFDEFQSRG